MNSEILEMVRLWPELSVAVWKGSSLSDVAWFVDHHKQGAINKTFILFLSLKQPLIEAAEHEAKDWNAFAGAGGVKLAMLAGLRCILPAPVKFGQSCGCQIFFDCLIE
jgi:hypothetical protein